MITTRKVKESTIIHEYTYIKRWWFSECVKCIPFECVYFHGVSQMMRHHAKVAEKEKLVLKISILVWAKVVYCREGGDVEKES